MTSYLPLALVNAIVMNVMNINQWLTSTYSLKPIRCYLERDSFVGCRPVNNHLAPAPHWGLLAIGAPEQTGRP